MKNFLKISFALICVFTLSHSAIAQAQNHIGIINLKKVFEGYWKTKQVRTVLEQSEADAYKQVKELVDSWDKSKAEYQKLLESANDLAVSTDERDKRKKSAEAKLRELKETEMTIQQLRKRAEIQLNDQQNSLRENLLKEIREAVNSKAKVAGYTLVLDSDAMTANGTPIVVYNNGENDLTDPVLGQLNVGAPADSKATAPKEEKKDK